VECPEKEGMYCTENGSFPYVSSSYWRNPVYPTDVYKCFPSAACKSTPLCKLAQLVKMAIVDTDVENAKPELISVSILPARSVVTRNSHFLRQFASSVY
jgi:hypothetical protein